MKKVLIIIVILFLSIAGYSLWSYARQVFSDAAAPLSEKATETSSAPAAKKVQDVAVCDVMSGLPFSVSYGEVMLSGPAGSVDAAMRIVVSGVDSALPPLDAGMVNVTAGHACYRFLPHGTRFGKEVHLTMGYDTARIPRGHSYKEIRTYYYDEQQRHWKPLPYDSVSTERGEVYSRTDHFTDMINAIISYPELPEGTSYTPTMLQEMEAAHPASGITLMEAPQAGSEGTATMHYPITLPQGRNGMQPDLNISYNSESGNGLLGMGWDMQVPAVSVDSKWGVPRYDAGYETECYLLNGQELLPSPHYLAAWEARNQAEKVFYPRTETSFDSITRKGTAPGNYFWEVRDKSGKKYYYGSYDGQHRQDSVLLKDACGNIAYWPLCRVEDMDGNLVMYYYHVEQQYSGTTYLGKQLWLESIRYTGNAKTGDTGIYTVFFSGEHCTETIRTRGDDITPPEDDCQCPDMFLKIHKTVAGSEIALPGIRFDLRDNTTDSENTYSTDRYGDIIIPILDCNHEFTLNEWFHGGYCNILRGFQFRLVKEDGICRFEIINHGNHPEAANNNAHPDSLILDIVNYPCTPVVHAGDSIYSARPHLPDNVYACMSPCDCEEEYPEDLRTDARWGFLHSGKNKLRRIVVYSGDSLVRSYSFCYGADVFGRAQLQKIRQWNADCSGESWDHEFSYYDDINQHFSVSDSVTVSNPASSIRISEKSCKNKELNLISRKLQITPSLLGSSRTWNAGIGGGFNIGLGKNVMNQEVTLELNLGGGGNWGKGLSTLTDVNGDGLPDAVYIRKDSVRYCLQTADRQFGNEQYLGVKRFLKDYSTNIHEGIGANCVAHGSLGSEQSKHVTNVYFTDLNGDGLLDIVDEGRVKTVMQGYKPPVVTVDTNCSEISICQGDAYQADEIVLPDLDYEEEHPLPELQPYDMVRFFVNQVCDRAMQIYAPVQFLPLGQGADSLEKDTVILSIEYYDNNQSFIVQQKMLTSDDFSMDWSGPLLTSDNPNLTNEAREFFFPTDTTCRNPASGCVFFFRVHPYNGRPIRHLLSWDPQIKYRNSCNSTEDVYSPHNLSAGAQLLQSDGTFYCPFKGKLHIKYEQTLNSTTLPTGQNISYTYSARYNQLVLFNHILDENNSTIQYDTVLSVDTGVVLTFSVRSNDIWENMHLNQWRPNVYYDSICIDNVMTGVLDYEENSSDTFKYFNYYPVPKYDLADQLFYCVYHSPSVAIENMFELQANTTLNILIDFQNQVINGQYTLYLVGDQGVLYRCTGYVNSSNISETVSIPADYNGPLWLECVFDGIPATSLPYNSSINGLNCVCVIYNISKNISHPLHKTMYGQWGQFQYKNENNENLIDTNFFAKCGKQDTTRLKSLISQMMFDSTQFAQYDTTQYSLWRNEVTDIFKLLPLTANGETQRYEGVFPNAYIQNDIICIGYLPDMTEWLSDDEDEDLPAEPVVPNESRSSVLPDASTSGRASRSGGKGCLLNKVSRSLNFNGNWSAMGMGQSASRSITYTTNDVMDLNGDGYPDIIHDGMVYYTKHKGVNWDFSSTSSIFAENNHLSKNYSIGNNFSAEPVKTVIVPNIRNKGMRTVIDGMPDVSGGNTVSEDRVEHTLADINGDGLPDLIYRNNKVRINTGYGFLPEKDWAGLSEIGVSTGTLQNVGVGDGTTLLAGTNNIKPLSEWHASISGGLSLNLAKNEQITVLLDINGDGLPDLVHKNSNDSIQYRLNTGIAFDSTWQTWYGDAPQKWGSSLTIGGNAALTGGITYMGIKLCGSVAVNASYTKNSEEVQFTDFDGDGLPDLLQENNNSLHVRYARLGRTGLLKAVANPLGGSIMLDYEMTDANVYHSRRWVMKEVKLSDGLPGDGADTLTTRYGYQYGYYDHAERRFSGFAKVSTFEINTNGDTLRTTERYFANNNVHLAGQMLAEVLYDSLHRRYVQTTNHISLDTLNTIGGAARVFPKLNATRTCYFEGLPQAPVTKIQTFEYENHYGNLVRQTETSTDQAKITANIFYHAQYNGNHCVNKVSRVDLRNGANVLLRRRTTDLDAMGHITAIHDYFDSTHCLSTRMEYDTCGNITVLRSPNTTTYFAYDSIANTYPTAVTDTFGIASYMQDYDYRFGVPRTIVDRAGNRMEYTLDAWGRTLTIRGPKEIAANLPYTIRHSYFGKDSLKAYASSLTEHYDQQHPGNSIKVRTYCDGLGRIVQTRKEAAVNGVEKQVVSGLQQYDALGRAVANYYPVETTLQDTAFAFVTDNIPPATVVYDVLDRPLLQTAPDGSSSTFLYGFDGSHLGKMLFKTTTTDANHHSSTELKDVNGQPWAIKAAGQPFVYFDYNAAGDNTRVYSSIANDWERIYAYDLLGRKLTYTEGELWDSYTYNGMNLSTYRQRWQESGQIRNKTTLYHYTAHRLDSVSYDDALTNIYIYDQYGRIDSLYDESGVMCYEYGNMGEVTKETRIYALPFLSQPLALSTLFEYDSWGRILNITYPDNEIVNYDYDLGGQLFRMYNNSSYTYLDNIIYDKFGAKISQDYGNGIVTQYTYNDTTRRLSEIATSNGALINYTYDLVGNVTQVSSICPWLPNQNFTETFTYDSTDQLLTAQESQNNGYQLAVNYGNWGKIMQYDLTQTDMLNNATSQISRSLTYPSHANNVGNSQTPFAPTMQNGDEDVFFTFGINGSLRKKETTQPQQHTEYYLFNSQGNLKAYSDDIMGFAYYGYNIANTRTYKLSLYNTNMWINGQQQPLNLQLQNAMFYPNTYLNFDAFGNYTKHYYNGMERIASRLGDNTITIAINNNILEDRKLQLEEQFREDIHKLIEETVPIDLPPFIDVNALQPTGTPNDIYYYHPNHLGSTSFVTDNNATITQGFLYAPFGEITTEYNINFGNNVIPKYSFNAKEFDEETGMYYYEARYYRAPTFTSRDPLFEKYFGMSPYAYCANNPVKYVDPSGEDFCNPDDPPKNKNQNNSKSSTTTTVGTSQTYNSYFFNVSISTSQTQGEQKLFNVDTKTSTETKTGEITSTTSYQFGKPQLNLSAEGGVSTSGSTTGKLNTTVVGIQTGIGLTSTQKIDDFQVTASLGYSNGEKSSNVAISVKPLRVAVVVTSALIVVASIATIHIPIVIPF